MTFIKNDKYPTPEIPEIALLTSSVFPAINIALFPIEFCKPLYDKLLPELEGVARTWNCPGTAPLWVVQPFAFNAPSKLNDSKV